MGLVRNDLIYHCFYVILLLAFIIRKVITAFIFLSLIVQIVFASSSATRNENNNTNIGGQYSIINTQKELDVSNGSTSDNTSKETVSSEATIVSKETADNGKTILLDDCSPDR